MKRWAPLLLPVCGICAFDPACFDDHAVKYLALAGGAVLCLAFARRPQWTSVALALWLFIAWRALALLAYPTGRSLRWVALLVTLALVHHAAPRRFLRRRAPLVLGALCAIVAATALVQALSGARQAHATFANRSFAAAGLAMLLPFALESRPRWRWPLLGLGLCGLLAMQSRGGALAAAAALTLWFCWRRPRWILPGLLGAAGLVLSAGLLLGESNTVKVRKHWYRAALDMGASNFLGTGLDGFRREYPPVRPLEEHAISGGRVVHSVHNDYLESFAETGWIGLLTHLFLVAAAARACRRNRAAACSLLAFAVASLVDLPLRDPSLVALAFLCLTLCARGGRALPAWPVALLLAIAAVWLPYRHWRADRAYARGDLDAALAFERRHLEALLTRRTPEDLRLVLEAEPHNAAALVNLAHTEEQLEAIFGHDPHHGPAHFKLARLVAVKNPERAVSLLERALEADPRPWQPYALLARIHRVSGNLDGAERYVKGAEARGKDPLIALERLDLELAHLAEGRFSPARFAHAMRQVPAPELERRVEAALARGDELISKNPRPKVERAKNESAAAHLKRIQGEQARWKRELDALTKPHYLAAFLMAEALKARHPTAKHFRQMARGARGVHDIARAARFEARALFLDALTEIDATRARGLLRRAVRADPELTRRRDVQAAVRAYVAARPQDRARLERLFRRHPALADALR